MKAADRIYYFSIVLLIVFISCRGKVHIPIEHQVALDSTFQLNLQKFGVMNSESLINDSNVLMLYGAKPFDTSFLIHLEGGTHVTTGTYYEILPSYHNNVNDFAIEENKLLYFDGYSFSLDSTKWEAIKTKTRELFASDEDSKERKACRDCSEYWVVFNSKIKKSNFQNSETYQSYYNFLKRLFLQNFILRRMPIRHQMKQ